MRCREDVNTGFFTYDDPPAPQEPPQHYTPLSPRRSRTTLSHRTSPSRDSNKSSMRTSTPLPSHISLSTSRTKSLNGTSLRPHTSDGSPYALSRPNAVSEEGTPNPDSPVTRGKSGITGSISDSPADSTSSALSETRSKNDISGLTAHVNAQKNKPTPTLCGAPGTSPKHKKQSSLTTTTTQRPRSNPTNPTRAGVGLTPTRVIKPKSNSLMGRNSEHDTRSMISSLLDAYIRSDTDDAPGEEYLWSDDRSTVFSDGTVSLRSVMDSPKSSFSDAPSSNMAASDVPQKHRKPSSLLISTSPPNWQGGSIALGLPALPQTAPAARNPRPLPPVPGSQRPVRPLPQPPVPPPYSSLATYAFPPTPSGDSPLSASSRTSASSSASSSPSSSNTTSFSSESPISSPSSVKLELDTLATQPKISKRPFLGPTLTIPPLSSGPPSPLTPDMPIPPSPMTAKRHQASKLSKMLGEEITPELLYDRQCAVHPPLHNRLPVIGAQVSTSNRRNQVAVPEITVNIPGAMTAITPVPTFRDTQTLTVRRRARNARPQAIYVQDSISDDFDNTNVGKEEGSESEDTESEGSTCSDDQMGSKLRVTAGEELQEMEQLSPASSRKMDSVVTSPSDSILEDELDDMEEAHIGWALQNVITYGTASRVKRTSRTWVLERNGQRWEEQNYDNVLQALRQL